VRVALATCANLPDWEVDDRPLFAALDARGVAWDRPVWDDPAVDWSAYDGVLVRTTWDYMERLDAYVAWADRVARVTRLHNPASVVRWNTRKTYLGALEALGVPIAPTVWLTSPEPLAPILATRGWERGFLKPVVGATARETCRFVAEDLALAQAHADRVLQREALMLQPYLRSVEDDGELSVIVIDGVPSHAVRKIPVPGDYRVQDDFGAKDVRIDLPDDLAALAAQALGAASLLLGGEPLLYGRVDALRGDDGRLVLNELELVEPSLFLRHAPEAADRLIAAWLDRLATPAG
jgi:glutathione synthase/RimK-type ligase-like ATP-grasp enzyme